jgi:hypothetical protein
LFFLSFLFLLMSLHGVDKMRQEDMIPIALFSHSIPVSCCLGRGDGGWLCWKWGLGWEIVTERASRRAHRLIRLYPYIYAERASQYLSVAVTARRGLFAGVFRVVLGCLCTYTPREQHSSGYIECFI